MGIQTNTVSMASTLICVDHTENCYLYKLTDTYSKQKQGAKRIGKLSENDLKLLNKP